MSFPIFFVIPAPLCHSLEGGNLSFFSVSVGVEFIRPVFSFCRGQIYLTRPYCELNESNLFGFSAFVCFWGYNHNINCLIDFNIASGEASIDKYSI
jgi:hypothetical protein